MKSCVSIADMMSLYVDGQDQLTDSDKAELEAHLGECPSCARDLEELQRVMEEMKNMQEVELPEDFHRDTMEKIRGLKKERRGVGYGKYAAAVAGILASLLLLSGVGAGLSYLSTAVQPAAQNEMIQEEMRLPEAATFAENEPSEDESERFAAPAANEMPEAASQMMAVAEDAQDILILADDTELRTDTGSIESDADADARGTIKNFNISLQVSDIDEALRVINSMNGYNTNARSNLVGDIHTAYVTRRVDAEQYASIVEVLQSLGEVTGQYESEETVTSQRLDAEARLRAKEEEKKRLFDMLTRATTMDVMVMVEERLSYVDHDVDDLKTTLMNLDGQTAMAMVTVDLYAPQAVADDQQAGQFSKRIGQSFISSLNMTIRTMENLVVWLSEALLPILILLAVVLLAVLVRRKLTGRRKTDGKE